MPTASANKNGARKKVHAVLHISKVEGLSGSLYCKVVLVRSRRSFVTPPSLDGTWDCSFSFTYDGEEEAHLEVVQKGWFGWEYTVGGTSIALDHAHSNKQSSYRLVLGGSTARLLMEVSQRVTNMPALSEVDGSHDTGGNDITGYIKEKFDFHSASLKCIAEQALNDGADEDVKSIMDELETSLREYNQQSCSVQYGNVLDNALTSSRNNQVSQEINFWNTLFKLSQAQDSNSHALIHPAYVENPSPVITSPSVGILPVPADVDILYEERLKSLQLELEAEKNMVQLLRTRNAELESEVVRKNADLLHLKENDAVRDKVVWERLELFDEKLRQIDVEREKLHELEMNLLERERELEDRERQLDKAVEDVRAKKDLNQLKAQSALHTSFSEDNFSRPSNSGVEHHLISISQKLAKLDHLDEVLSRMQHTISSSSGSRSPMKQSKRSASDIKAEMEKLQQIILDDKAQDKEREAANLKIDRLFVELASTDEYKQEIKRAQEEKIRVNEPLNKEALQEMLRRYQEQGSDEDIVNRKKLYAALTLIGMDRDTILGKHQNDFNQFLLGDLALVELRAIRASLPAFRRDQKKQLEFVEAVDLKIEQLMKNPVKIPAKPKRVFPSLPLGGSAGNSMMSPRTPRTATVSMGNLAAELLAKRKKVEAK